MTNIWTEANSWSENWKQIHKIEGGAQATTARAARLSDSQEGFLKILNQQNDSERRARFSREANAYATFKHPGLPNLIESNAHLQRDINKKLYLALDFIEGETVTNFVKKRGPLPLVDAIVATKSLLITIEYFHGQQIIHRDIKPGNLIFRNSNIADVVVVDFGLCFSQLSPLEITEDHRTELGQELGNRFIRLPELAVDALNKQDHRSDLAMVGGIFFYLLTQRQPGVLMDDARRLPHQREVAAELFENLPVNSVSPLKTFLDRALGFSMQERYQSATDMRRALETLVAQINDFVGPPKNPAQNVWDLLMSDAILRTRKIESAFRQGANVVERVHSLVGQTARPMIVLRSGGNDTTVNRRSLQLGYAYEIQHSQNRTAFFEISLLGVEYVITCNSKTIHREPYADPKFDSPTLQIELDNIFNELLVDLLANPPH